MHTDKSLLIYFSPTGTTEKIVKSIAAGLGSRNVREISLTFVNDKSLKIDGNEIAVIGVPVYAGRVPETFIERFKSVDGKGNPAVLAVVYGNRAFDDALLELRNLCIEKNFKVAAAGAFIGEHSFSNNDKPLAAGRPDKTDLMKAESLGKDTAEKLESDNFSEPEIPGNFPYRDGTARGGVAPDTDNDKCVICGKCVSVCPENLIVIKDSVYTDFSGCIKCCACIKACPESARSFNHQGIDSTRNWLFENTKAACQPEIFM